MKIFHSLSEIPTTFGPTVATIGNFDGVHAGHCWVISEVVTRARALGIRSIAITFDPHPVRILRPEAAQPLITPLHRKVELLAATGIDAVLILPFTAELSRTTARAFATEVLKQTLHVTELHEGENFRFGYQAEGGIDTLSALGTELGFTVRVYTPRTLRHEAVSSSRIRQLIADGQVSHARTLLGRPFSIESTPASGRGYGTRYTVPTINLAPYAELLPANGVYVTCIQVGIGPTAETFDAITNIGNRPTFAAEFTENPTTVETHLLNFHPIPLDESTPLTLTFLRRLRPEIHWPSPEALRTQISLDVQQAQHFFSLFRAVASTHPTATPAPHPAPQA